MKPLVLIFAAAIFFNRQINTMLTVDGAFTYYLPSIVKIALGLIALTFAYRVLKAITKALFKITAKVVRKTIALAKRLRASRQTAADQHDVESDEYDDYVPVPYDEDETIEFAPIAPARTGPTYDDETYWLDEPVPAA